MGGGIEDAFEVHVEPVGLTLRVAPGESVMTAAQRDGYSWPSICGGQAMCGACTVRVLAGAEHVDAPQAQEQARLKLLTRSKDRLACQLTVTGPVTVFKRGVKAPPVPVCGEDGHSS